MGNARSHKDLEENQNEKESNQFIRNRNVSSQHVLIIQQTPVHPQIPQQMLLQMQQQTQQQRKHRQLQQTLMQVNMSMYYPARMDPVQEVHSSNYLESKKKTQTEIKWTTQQRKRSSQTAHP